MRSHHPKRAEIQGRVYLLTGELNYKNDSKIIILWIISEHTLFPLCRI